MFDEAIAVALANHANRHQPVTEELAAVTAVIDDKARIRYQDDYEAGKLAAERYETRARELDDDLGALRARAADLQLQLDEPDLPAAPTAEKLQELRDVLAQEFRTGDVVLRKTLYTTRSRAHRPRLERHPHHRPPVRPGIGACERPSSLS